MTPDDPYASPAASSRRGWLPSRRPFRYALLSLIGLVVLLVVAVLVGVATYVRPGAHGVIASAGSMQPAVRRGDHLLIDPDHSPRVGVIVEYRRPEEMAGEFLSRVAAVGGQTISCPATDADPHVCRGVVVDGHPLDDHLNPDGAGAQAPFPAVSVPRGQVFLLGDNRNDSSDSRFNGPVPTSDVVGKVRLRYLPLSRFGDVA